MKQIASFIFFSAICCSSFGGTLEDLKHAPATRYDLGVLEIELGVFLLTQRLKGQKVGGTDFRLEKFDLLEAEGKLIFQAILRGNAQNLTDDACRSLNKKLEAMNGIGNMDREVWRGLTEKQYESLDSEFLISTKLVAFENDSLTIEC